MIARSGCTDAIAAGERAQGSLPLARFLDVWFGWSARPGTGLLAMMAGPDARSGEAGAHAGSGAVRSDRGGPGMPQPIPQCCALTHPHKPCEFPAGRPQDFTCPPGFNPNWHFCCEGTRVMACGECTGSDNSWQGPFICSIWWETQSSC
jgi:hypothetical protein